jgi:hypothetical protein
MIWAALLIGATALLAIWTVRSRSNEWALGDPSRWLVLPDEPAPKALAIPQAVCAGLPAIVVARPSWSAMDESWRAEKPFQPWFRSPAPCAVAVAVGAMSLDLTALGLGLPEIMPTHLPLHDRHDRSDAVWPAFEREAPHAAHEDFGIDLAAWGQSDFIVPSWEHAPSHDWWA